MRDQYNMMRRNAKPKMQQKCVTPWEHPYIKRMSKMGRKWIRNRYKKYNAEKEKSLVQKIKHNAISGGPFGCN